MKNYKKELDKLYNARMELDYKPNNKLEFIGNHIFGFTTYDSNIDELFAGKMIKVIQAILDRKTFEYIDKGEDNYINYLTMVNMPFLKDKLEWGTSIRGAWFDEYGSSFDKDEFYSITYEFKILKKEINNFMKQLIEWSNE